MESEKKKSTKKKVLTAKSTNKKTSTKSSKSVKRTTGAKTTNKSQKIEPKLTKKEVKKSDIKESDNNVKGGHGYLISVLLLLLVIILFYVPTSYDIDTDGGLIDLNGRIGVTPSNDMKGSINLSYVGGKRGTIASLILSKFIPSWDAYKSSDIRMDDETYEASLRRGKVSLKESEQNAKYVALKAAGYDTKITAYDITVIYIYKEADTDLRIGDIIKKVDGKEIKTSTDAVTLISSHAMYDKISLTVLRDNKEIDCYAIIHELEGRSAIGIIINPIVEISIPDDVKINMISASNTYGSSGGLTNALYIYNRLTEEDITNGDVISGTGEILINGIVNEVAGIKYKLRGAYKKGAKVFIVPSANYEEALKIKEENNMDIELIEAKSFYTVVEDLKKRFK